MSNLFVAHLTFGLIVTHCKLCNASWVLLFTDPPNGISPITD